MIRVALRQQQRRLQNLSLSASSSIVGRNGGNGAASTKHVPISPMHHPWSSVQSHQEHTLSRKMLIERMLRDLQRRQEKQKRLRARRLSYQPPPPSDPLIQMTSADTPEERKLVPVLARPDLLITRNIEWANVAFGLEQQNRYVVMDPRQPQAPVGHIMEQSNFILRQLLRSRRPFVADILDAYGVQIYQVRRPVWVINSTIYVDIDGKLVGEVHRRWHLWRRIYDLYIGKTQFGRVVNPGFWNWTFTVCDEEDNKLAEIDRNWRGIGYEFFTDAGQYVVRFGETLREGANLAGITGEYVLQAGGQPQNVDPQVEPLNVARSLNLQERAIVLALAISLDNDYFSRHSAGFGLPIIGTSE